MPTQLIATGNAAADSADLVVAAGTPVTVCLKSETNDLAQVLIKLKDDVGGYTMVGSLTSQSPAVCITAPGTYRFSRIAGAACGVFRA